MTISTLLKYFQLFIVIIFTLNFNVNADIKTNNLLAKSLQVTTPNGGEIWQAGTQQNITWNSNEVDFISIEYSTNNGTTWQFITGTVSATLGIFEWTIPSNINTTQGLIRIVDIDDGAVFDVSDANFTIKRLQFSSIASGESLQEGKNKSITFSVSPDIGLLTIEYSTDNGNSWTTIATNHIPTNPFNWSVPNTPTSQGRLRATDQSDNSIFQISNQFIIKLLTLTSPNGSENLASGENYIITWNSNLVSLINIEYSTDNGLNWNTVANNVSATGGSFSWLVPNTPTNAGRVRITDVSASHVNDLSDAVFSITTLDLLSPNGGEGLAIGSNYNILWNSNLTSNIRIDISYNNGLSWDILNPSITGNLGSYVFVVPNVPTTQAKIRLVSLADTTKRDESASTFTIGSITLNEPITAINWIAGTTNTIKWNRTSSISLVNIEYSLDNGTSWNSVVSSFTASADSFQWSIPNNIGSLQARIRISDALTGTSISSVSGMFTISRLTLLTPISSDVWPSNTNQNITWSSVGLAGNLTIEYSTNNGTSWNIISSGVSIAAGTFNWAIPLGLASNQMRIRLTTESAPIVNAMSSAPFRIGFITLTSPNGGENIFGGSQFNITWNSSNNLFLNLDYSTDNGTTWTNFADEVPSSNGQFTWNVPVIGTTMGLIRVRDKFGPLINDQSDAVFSVPTLIVTAPNGGEGFKVGTNTNITWTSSSIANVAIDFSTNAGITWTNISASTPAAAGTFTWNVTNTPTSNGLIRVRDVLNPSFNDISNNEFVVGNINVLTPNGGEVLQGNKPVTFTWSSTISVNNVNIELSTNNGTTWNLILASVNASSGSATVNTLNFPTNLGLIRITDAAHSNISDVSDAVFTIRNLNLTSPNGGEFYQVDSVRNITWTSNNVSNVRLEYSTNNGTTWSTIIASVPSTPATFAWTIPNTPTSTALVRISDVADLNDVFDISDANFTISSLRIISPNGSETFAVGSAQTITWESFNLISDVRLEYTTNNGTTWILIENSIPNVPRSYIWNVPNTPTTNARVRITDVDNTSVFDISDNVFTIGSLQVTSPNGGEKFQVGKTYPITWLSVNTITNVDIEFSTNNGTTWNSIVSNLNASLETYNWTVPNNVSSNALVRIFDSSNPARIDVSNNVFTIASLEITSPNGTENLQVGNIFPITWNSSNVTNVNLEYSSNNGTTWSTIANNLLASDGTFAWTIPNLPSNTALIRITDSDFAGVNDVSDATFRVIRLFLTSPNGGNGFIIGSSRNITWNSSGVTNVSLEYSVDGGLNWILINNSVTASLGTFSWSVPNNPSNQVRVRVSDSSIPSIRDSSDNNFTIGEITVTNPLAGDIWQAGTQRTISWTATSGISNVTIQHSTNGGTDWENIAVGFNASLGSFNWSIPPSIATTNERIRVFDSVTGTNGIIATTGLFTITNLQVTSPNGGEVVQSGTVRAITWTSQFITNVRLEYSLNNGTTWHQIVASTPAITGTFNWNVPADSSSNQALIRISDAGNPSIFDLSNSTFRIGNVQLLTPIASSIFQGGTSRTITWNATSSITNLQIEYSLDGGTSWNNIVASTPASTGTYTWNPVVNGIESNSALIRISDPNFPNDFFSVSSPFTIQYLNLTSPNGGERWQAGSTQNILWNSSTNISTLTIEYTTNNGSTWELINNNVTASDNSFTWNIPSNVTSSQARIRLINNSANSVRDSSSTTFVIPQLQITAPVLNAHLQTGLNTNITWNSANVNTIRLEYSSDNGATWNLINNSVNASTGSFTWEVPNSSASNLMRIQISDNADLTVNDISQLFKTSTIALTSPNGGEQFQAGSVQPVTWNSANISNVMLEYSTNDGTSWNTIVASTPAAAGTFNWNIPSNISTTQARVRVSDASNNAILDISDNTFSINSLTITSPIGGEKWQAGTTRNITWTGNGSISNVNIQFSSDGGGTWNDIVSSTPAAPGTFAWLIPSTLSSNQMRVRVRNVSNLTIQSSSADFDVIRLDLTSPDGGEFVQSGLNRNIQWVSGNVANIKIEYSSNNGTSWNEIIASTPAAGGNYTWSVPAALSSNQTRIRISDVVNSTIRDSSSNPFRTGTITVNAPNGGEIFQGGSTTAITWSASSSISNVRIDYSTNNGTDWINITTSTSAAPGTFNWNIPSNVSTSNGLIRISDNESSFGIVDVSDNVFIINSLLLTSPNGGEFFQVGNNYSITWTAGSNITNVRLDYSTDNGATWNLINNSVNAALGTFTWNVPNISTIQGRIRVSNSSNVSIFDISDAAFKVGNVTVTSPNGGERWQIGRIRNITWTNSASVTQVDLFFSTNNGTTWTTISSGVNASLGSFAWTVPASVTQNALVRVTDAASSLAIFDVSDAVFTISNLLLTAPVAGNTLLGGVNHNINWNRSADVTNVDLYYSTNNGTTWTLIEANVNAVPGTYSWNAPININSSTSRIRILDNSVSTIGDTTGQFTIYYPSLAVTSPNGGEYFQQGRNYNITWTSTLISNVSLEYSTNNGTTWNLITNSTPAASGSFIWNVPAISSSGQARIRISDALNPSVRDSSDNPFTIGNVSLTILNGGEGLQTGTTVPINWTATASVSNVRLDYTTNNGTTWVTIIASTPAAAGTFNWLVPNAATNQARIRISDAASSLAIFNQSLDVFSIYSLAITSPNGGEEFQAGQNYNITWTSSSNISNIKLEYSTNNGTNWIEINPSVTASLGTFNWNVPSNISTANALIKATDVLNNNVRDSSDAVFSIKRLLLTAPVGGENWQSNSVQAITWENGALITNVRLEYSTNNGVSWITIIASTPAAAGTFNWNIPNVTTTNARVRISDASNTNILSTSQTFSIFDPLITLTSPNGGENWLAGSTRNITWTQTFMNNVMIELSTNNGVTFEVITNSTPAAIGSFTWVIPNTLSTTQALIRISDVANPTIIDVSDAVFTISRVRVDNPNGNEIVQVGSNFNINWTVSTHIANVRLDYSTNNGTNWINIITSTPANTGTFAWSVPDAPTEQALIRISDAAVGVSISDVSDKVFSIVKLNITSPNGGQIWLAGSTRNITWNQSFISNVRLEYSTDNGTTFETIIPSTPANTGSFAWTIPSNLSTTTGLIRITDASNPTVTDLSDAVFTISRINVTSPNGSEVVQVGSNQNITWTASAHISNVRIDYSTNNGTTWITLSASTANTGSFAWVVPNTPTNQGRVRISDASVGLTIFDTSDDEFTISGLALTFPNGGETLLAGSTRNITWNQSFISNVRLEYSTDNGTTFELITNSTSATSGSFAWTIPSNLSTTTGLIRITDASNPTVTDLSDAVFTISRINVTSPNGSEVVQVGSNQNITWTASAHISNVRIDYSTNNGTTWITLSASTANTGSFAWVVPNTPTNQGRVRISDASVGLTIFDTSDDEFTISGLALTFPNGGETLLAGSTRNITWNQSFISNVRLEYSTDNGTTFELITNSTSATSGSFAWTIPSNLSTTTGLIRITDASNPTVTDLSDAVFTISRINVTSPNGSEVVQVGSNQNITWTASAHISNVRIDYSTNNGTTWITLSASTANTGSFAWVVPNTPTNQGRVRISDASVGLTIFDTSDDEFTISGLALTFPNGGETLLAGSTRNITWNQSFISNVRLEYSTDNGTTFELITNSTSATSGSFAWTIPSNLSTTTGLIRISDASNPTVTDLSDAVFTISRINVTSPNGSEVVQVGSNQNITWTASAHISNVRIDYSTNNGTTWITLSASTANTGSFAWVVPNTPTNQGRVRISDASVGLTIFDTSDEAFSIIRLTLTSPNGGENFQAGRNYNITWTSSSNLQNVDIYYSTNNGTSWNTIVLKNPASSGTFNWLVPSEIFSTQALIRINDSNEPTVADTSNSTFNIRRLEIVSPLGGENWQANTQQIIRWSVNNINILKLEYSTNNGTSWTTITEGISSTPDSLVWLTPNISSSQMLVRISDSTNNQIFRTSNGFSLFKPEIIVTSPNGGEVWQAGTTRNITWTSTLVENVRIEYSANNGLSWNTVINSTPAASGTFSWLIPDTLFTLTARVKITNLASTQIVDSSDNPFTVSLLNITSPNGNEVFMAGTTTNINWNASSNIANVRLDYSTNSGSTWNLIINSTPAAAGTFSWNIPLGLASSNMRIRVRQTNNTSIVAVSDSNFKVGWITLLSPNGNENLQSGKTHTVTWNRSNNINNVTLEYDLNNDGNWATIVSDLPSTPTSYTWQVPNGISSNNAKFRISEEGSGLQIFDISDTTYFIRRLNLVSPLGGESWQAGTNQIIRWEHSNNINFVNVEYSINNGISWDTVRTNLNANDSTVVWSIPLTAVSDSVKIKVSSSSIPAIFDSSQRIQVFTPTIALTSPNGGEYVQAGKQFNITWNSSFVNNIKIEYSTNNGANWLLITNSIPAATGNFVWSVNPNISTTQALVKITDAVNPFPVDSSLLPFTIGWVEVTSPNGGENWQSGIVRNITWNHSTSVSNVNIYYNIDSVWRPIELGVPANLQSYSWSVPFTASSNARVRITDAASNFAIFDSSDALFSISTLALLSPNGGESFQAGSTQNITWTNSENITSLRIEFSSNSGNSWTVLSNSFNAASGTFTWNVPLNIFSDSCLIRIRNVIDLTVGDTSDNVFRISRLSLVSPNSSEKLLVGSTKEITWNTSDNISLIDLHYTTNNGTSWLPIALSLNAQSASYNWIVPNTPSDSVFVRIRNSNDLSFFNINPGLLTISLLTLTTPNGGQIWQTGTTRQIVWQSSFVNNINIEIKADNQNDWIQIASNISAPTGIFNWNIPDNVNFADSNYRVRITDVASNAISDTSLNIFTISHLKLLSPNGDVGQQIGTAFNILWENSNNTIQNVKLEYSTNNGNTWILIENSIPAAPGSYAWNIPNTPTAQALVRISDASVAGINDISDNTFTISSLQLTFPNGGASQKLQAGKTYSVRWNSGFINNVRLEYSINNGVDWNLIPGAENISAALGRFDWHVENAPSQNSLVRISDVSMPGVFDVSDTSFTIVSLRVVTPNTVTAYQLGSVNQVTWESQFIDSVRVQLSIDGGLTYPFNLGIAKADSGKIIWTAPNIKTTQARIRISDRNDLSINDVSDTTFVITTFPKVSAMRYFQKDTINFILDFGTPGEVISLTRFEYELGQSSPIIATNFIFGDYSAIPGPTVDTIRWLSKNNLNNFEGIAKARFVFNSNFNVEYTVVVDSFGVDNLSPIFNSSTVTSRQNPYKLGWHRIISNWTAASDTNRPIKYSVFFSETNVFPNNPFTVTQNDSIVISGLKTSTNYNMKINVEDGLGNFESYIIPFKTYAAADFNGDNRIDAVDLVEFVRSWSRADSVSGADLFPYQGEIPFIRVQGDLTLDIDDLTVFVRMWNYFQENGGLPKANSIDISNSIVERKTLKFKKGENKIDFPIDIDSSLGVLALGVHFSFDKSVFELDSLFVSSTSSSPLTLIYKNNESGYINIDHADLYNNIKGNFNINSHLNYNFDRNSRRDSLYVIIKGYDESLNEVINKTVIYTLQEIPASYALYQNYPNPFNPMTTIEYDLPEISKVTLKVYDILGREVATLINNEEQIEGTYRYQFDSKNIANGLASGVYLYRLQTDNYTLTKKMILLK